MGKNNMPQPVVEWPFVPTRPFLTKELGIGPNQITDYVRSLPASVYWIKPGAERYYRWNRRLMVDLIFNGPSERHDALVEEFVAWVEAQTKAPSNTGRAA